MLPSLTLRFAQFNLATEAVGGPSWLRAKALLCEGATTPFVERCAGFGTIARVLPAWGSAEGLTA